MKFEDLKVVQPPTLVREQALEKLRGAIINGLYPPGARLIERELCEVLGVSRTSVREVLRQLEAEGLVDVGARQHRPIVAQITEQQALEIYELREVLETFVVRRFIVRCTAEDLRRLREIYEEIAEAVRAGDLQTTAESAGRFCDSFYVGAGNETIRDVMRQMMARISYLRLRSLAGPGRLQSGLNEVKAILKAVEARDLEAAQIAVATHIRNNIQAAIESMRAEATKRKPPLSS